MRGFQQLVSVGEAIRWLDDALAGSMPDRVRVAALWTAGWAAYSKADYAADIEQVMLFLEGGYHLPALTTSVTSSLKSRKNTWERSARPSTRAGRKWRWNARTTASVGGSWCPDGAMP
mgnify:CR=1 FL=1